MVRFITKQKHKNKKKIVDLHLQMHIHPYIYKKFIDQWKNKLQWWWYWIVEKAAQLSFSFNSTEKRIHFWNWGYEMNERNGEMKMKLGLNEEWTESISHSLTPSFLPCLQNLAVQYALPLRSMLFPTRVPPHLGFYIWACAACLAILFFYFLFTNNFYDGNA